MGGLTSAKDRSDGASQKRPEPNIEELGKWHSRFCQVLSPFCHLFRSPWVLFEVHVKKLTWLQKLRRTLFGCPHEDIEVKEYFTTAEGTCLECGARFVRWHGVWM